MDKKEFVQQYMINNSLLAPETAIIDAIKIWDMIEREFAVTPTKDLWDYNDMQR